MIARYLLRRQLRRATHRIGILLDEHQWLPLAVVLVVLYFINS